MFFFFFFSFKTVLAETRFRSVGAVVVFLRSEWTSMPCMVRCPPVAFRAAVRLVLPLYRLFLLMSWRNG